MAHEDGLVRADVVEEGEHVAEEQVVGVLRRVVRDARLAVATEVPRDRPVPSLQRGSLRVPHAPRGLVPVREKHGGTVARYVVADLDPVELRDRHRYLPTK